MALFDDFFRDVDRAWTWPLSSKIKLPIIGSAALMMQTSYRRGTKDGDVLETVALTDETKARLSEIAGQATAIHKRRKIYLDLVANGIPFLPQRPLFHALEPLNGTLASFEIEVLDVVDVVVSKLKRFSANDKSDIEAMIHAGLVPHSRLKERFEDAFDFVCTDARADQLPRYLKNLNQIERDELGVAETEIELPEWLDR